MTAFALSSEVRDLLAKPEDPLLLQNGQKYTEDFAAVKGIFEGLYIVTPSTYILTHTSQNAIGITTRSGESLDEFRYNFIRTTADQSGNHEISRDRQHDTFHVLSAF